MSSSKPMSTTISSNAGLDRKLRRKGFLPRQCSVQSTSSTSSQHQRYELNKQMSIQNFSSFVPVGGLEDSRMCLPYHLVDEPLTPSPHHPAAGTIHSLEDYSSGNSTSSVHRLTQDCKTSLLNSNIKETFEGESSSRTVLENEGGLLTADDVDEQSTPRRNSFNEMRNFLSLDVDQTFRNTPSSCNALSSTVRRNSKSMETVRHPLRESSLEVSSEPPDYESIEMIANNELLAGGGKPIHGGSSMQLNSAIGTDTTHDGNLRSGTLRRKWPSFRARLSRISSTVIRSQHSLSTNYSTRNNVEDSALFKSLDLETPHSNKRDAKVQFDENVNLHENGSNIDPYFEEMMKTSRSSKLKEQFFAFFQPSDNRLAMKLFGNKNALMKEKERQQQHGRWVIHPCSNFRFYWDLLMLVLLISNLVILPVAISFFNDDLSLHWIIFNCISDTVFLCDIVVNFRTGVITNDYADEIILNPRLIARYYIRTWFFLDLVSSIPMDYIFLILNGKNNVSQLVHAGRALRILRLAKLLSLLRLLRLSRLVRYVSQWEEFLNIAGKFMGIFNLVLLMLLLGHWNACLQFLIPTLSDYPVNSWVVRCDLQAAFWFEQYTWAVFKALSHMLGIGYGRFPPTSTSEAWITIISMMTGATCYALFVGHAAALIQSFDTSKRLYREKFKQVEEYMSYRKLPRGLRQRIASYYEHRYQGKMFHEPDILSELSECLREQIINYNCRALVAAVPFFTYADQDFVSEVVTKLTYEVFQPGDLIIKEGTIGTQMYFIQEGIVDIITKDGEVATSLSDGSYFGEICLLTNAKRVASVRAETYCNVYSLEREHFLSVLNNYPLMRRTMEGVAAERLSKIGQNPHLVSNREDLNEDLNLVKEIVKHVTPMPSDIEEDDEEAAEVAQNTKKERRKSVVMMGLQKLGFTKSKSNIADKDMKARRLTIENATLLDDQKKSDSNDKDLI